MIFQPGDFFHSTKFYSGCTYDPVTDLFNHVGNNLISGDIVLVLAVVEGNIDMRNGMESEICAETFMLGIVFGRSDITIRAIAPRWYRMTVQDRR